MERQFSNHHGVQNDTYGPDISLEAVKRLSCKIHWNTLLLLVLFIIMNTKQYSSIHLFIYLFIHSFLYRIIYMYSCIHWKHENINK